MTAERLTSEGCTPVQGEGHLAYAKQAPNGTEETATRESEARGIPLSPVAVARGIEARRDQDYAAEGHASSEIDFYDQIIIPKRVDENRAISVTITGCTEIEIDGKKIPLTGHDLFLFNAFMMCRDNPRITKKDIWQFGFHPTALHSTRKTTYQKAINNFMSLINKASRQEVIQRHGIKRGTFYTVSPDFGITAVGHPLVPAVNLPQETKINTKPALSEGKAKKADKESKIIDRLVKEILNAYGEDARAVDISNRYLANKSRSKKARSGPVDSSEQPERTQYRSLSREEVVELCSMICAGREAYGKIKAEKRDVTSEEEELLVRLVAAHRVMHACNRGLVVNVAKKYFPLASYGYDVEDMISEGKIGLDTAIRRFDASLGYAFSTYAVPWIRHAVKRGFENQGRTIRLPSHLHEEISKLRQADSRLLAKLQKIPTTAEIAEYTGKTEGEVTELLGFGKSLVLSLGTPLGKVGSGERVLDDIVAAPDDEGSIDRHIEKLSARHTVEELSSNAGLTDGELVILGLRFGVRNRAVIEAARRFEGAAPGTHVPIRETDAEGTPGSILTQEEVCAIFGVTSVATVRNREAKILKKLRDAVSFPN